MNAAQLALGHQVALLLLLVVLARVVAGHLPSVPWRVAGYALALGAAAGAALAIAGVELALGVLLPALAVLEGLYWHGLVTERPKASLRRHALAAAGGVACAIALLAASAVAGWWALPLALLVAMAAGLAWHQLPRRVQDRVWRAKADLAPAPQRGGGQSPAPAPAPAGRLALRCPACGFAGSVPESLAGRTLGCPRCRTPVAVPGLRAGSGVPAAAARPPRRTS